MKGSSVCRSGCNKDTDVRAEMTRWHHPPADLILHEGELHLWRFKLDSSKEELDALKGFLSEDEVKRADRLLDLQKKNQFIVARFHLKAILGRYLKIDPDQVRLQYNSYGKPALAEAFHSSVSFNLSHSGDWGVVAVVNKFAIGIDLEKIDPQMAISQLADRYFDENEKLQLAQYPPGRRRRGFYRLWTQKEARLKLAGVGFQKNPFPDNDLKTVKRHIVVFPLAPGFVCSVATTEKLLSIQKFYFLRK